MADDLYAVIDVACPYVNSDDSLEIAANRKIEKYEMLCTNIMQSTGKRVNFFPFVIGSLGSYYLKNEELLRQLGIRPRFRTLLRKAVVLAAIEGSAKIWNFFIDTAHRNRMEQADEERRNRYVRRRRQPLQIQASRRTNG